MRQGEDASQEPGHALPWHLQNVSLLIFWRDFWKYWKNLLKSPYPVLLFHKQLIFMRCPKPTVTLHASQKVKSLLNCWTSLRSWFRKTDKDKQENTSWLSRGWSWLMIWSWEIRGWLAFHPLPTHLDAIHLFSDPKCSTYIKGEEWTTGLNRSLSRIPLIMSPT